MFTKPFNKLILLSFTMFNAITLHSYNDTQTHPFALTGNAYLLIKNNYSTYNELGDYFNNHPKTIIDLPDKLIGTQGTEDEDDYVRFFNHFYNPKTKSGLGPNEDAVSYCQQFWDAAISDYKSDDKNDAYHNLGRFLHLLQDLHSPAHVVIDLHGFGDDCETWAKDNYDAVIRVNCSANGPVDFQGDLIEKDLKSGESTSLVLCYDLKFNIYDNNYTEPSIYVSAESAKVAKTYSEEVEEKDKKSLVLGAVLGTAGVVMIANYFVMKLSRVNNFADTIDIAPYILAENGRLKPGIMVAVKY
ncbi:MAG: hypothetical protein ABII27_01945 [bacterium]